MESVLKYLLRARKQYFGTKTPSRLNNGMNPEASRVSEPLLDLGVARDALPHPNQLPRHHPWPHPYQAIPFQPNGLSSTVDRLPLEAKLGQLIMPAIRGIHLNEASAEYKQLEHQTQQLGVGGFILFEGDIYESAVLIHRLQSQASIPLLIGSRLRARSRLPHSPCPPPALEHGRGSHPIGAMGLLAGTGHRPGSPKPGGQLDFCAGGGCQQQSGQPGHQHSILRRGPSNSRPSGCGICRGSPAGRGAGNGQAFSGSRRYRGGFPSVFAGDFRAAPTVGTDRVGSLSGGDRGRCHGDHDGSRSHPGLGERPRPPGLAFGRGTGTGLEERTGVSGLDRIGLHEDAGPDPRILERRSGCSGRSGPVSTCSWTPPMPRSSLAHCWRR